MSKPLFMWAGGKTKMLKKYARYLPQRVDHYCEPFFGGGAMFIHVMNHYKPRGTVVINDINPALVNIYRSIRDNRAEFQAHLDILENMYLPKNKEDRKAYYYEVRRQHAFDYEQWSPTVEAATLYFLMKTGFNGIYQINKNTNGRYGTPSGLLNQQHAIYDRGVLDWWERNLQGVHITNGEWENAVALMPTPDTQVSYYFFDPPYRDSFADYGNSFNDTALSQLVAYANTRSCVLLSNRESDDGWFEKHRDGLSLARIPVTYTAGRRKKTSSGFAAKKATEILLYSDHPKLELE